MAATFTETAEHPIDDLVLRWARTHGPFVVPSIAQRYGLGRAIVESACGWWRPGHWSPVHSSTCRERHPANVASTRHSRAGLDQETHLARLRKGVEPVEQIAFARFLAEWQGVGRAAGVDAVLGAIEQLSGYSMPASAVESMILPARVADYSPSMLDELTAAGEIYWRRTNR